MSLETASINDEKAERFIMDNNENIRRRFD